MVNVNNFFNNPNIKTINSLGNVKVLEYQKDFTMNPMAAEPLYYCDRMGVRKRQVAFELKNTRLGDKEHTRFMDIKQKT